MVECFAVRILPKQSPLRRNPPFRHKKPWQLRFLTSQFRLFTCPWMTQTITRFRTGCNSVAPFIRLVTVRLGRRPSHVTLDVIMCTVGVVNRQRCYYASVKVGYIPEWPYARCRRHYISIRVSAPPGQIMIIRQGWNATLWGCAVYI